jgi:hypothetical protein
MEADYSFLTSASSQLDLTLLDNNDSGAGFQSLYFAIYVDGSLYGNWTFTSLGAAEAFFSGNILDLGLYGAGKQSVDLIYDLTMNQSGQGFGFDYAGDPTAAAAPEASTFAMLLIGFAGLGFAAFGQANRAKATAMLG